MEEKEHISDHIIDYLLSGEKRSPTRSYRNGWIEMRRTGRSWSGTARSGRNPDIIWIPVFSMWIVPGKSGYIQ